MAKGTRTSASRKPVGAPPSQEVLPRRGLVWPLWTAAILGVLYLAAHASMVPSSLSMWGGLLSALVLGQ